MFLESHVKTQITNQGAYYLSKGYAPEMCKQGSSLDVAIADLAPNSNKQIRCQCDRCGGQFSRTYQRLHIKPEHLCYQCDRKYVGSIIDYKAIARNRRDYNGENHPRWNPNKSEFKAYGNKVRWLSEKTYRLHKLDINPSNLPRTRCGVSGGYQLDHIVSIKRAFEQKWLPEQCAMVTNLQMLPWKTNRTKFV